MGILLLFLQTINILCLVGLLSKTMLKLCIFCHYSQMYIYANAKGALFDNKAPFIN